MNEDRFSQKLLHKAGQYHNSDENYTPAYAVVPIIKYIPKGSIVWCPFDTEESQFVKLIREAGFEVVHSHIDEGKDFFKGEPPRWDVIVSNPPFKKKRLFFERALSFGKPFALLMTLACFNDKYPAWSFYEAGKDMQLLKFDKRIRFNNPDGRPNDKVTFQSGYICCDMLPKGIVMEVLDETIACI